MVRLEAFHGDGTATNRRVEVEQLPPDLPEESVHSERDTFGALLCERKSP